MDEQEPIRGDGAPIKAIVSLGEAEGYVGPLPPPRQFKLPQLPIKPRWPRWMIKVAASALIKEATRRLVERTVPVTQEDRLMALPTAPGDGPHRQRQERQGAGGQPNADAAVRGCSVGGGGALA